MMEARLVLTDALIAESLRRSKRGGKLSTRAARGRISGANSPSTQQIGRRAGAQTGARTNARETERWRR